MNQLAQMPKQIKGEAHEISLVNVYVELELLKNKVANQDEKLNEILSISKENQEKLHSLDNVKSTFKTGWKILAVFAFLSFMFGLVVDDYPIVKKFYNFITLS